MSYSNTLEYLYNQLPMYQRIGKVAYKADLHNTIFLDNHLLHPHKNFKSIHIAGTNGKGSVSHYVASILQEGGYKTGLYTSPHLLDFRERIKVNGCCIEKDFIADFVDKNKYVFDTIQPSFFEITVAMAFAYFDYCNVDIAIIETGLGGRLDSTNIITPIISVITNISKDHTNLLGNTLEKIAFEKAGIIKPRVPVVIGETHRETKDIFVKKAVECNTSILFCDTSFKVEINELNQYRILNDNNILFDNVNVDLKGSYQKKNICTVFGILHEANKQGYIFSEETIRNGLANVVKNTQLLGRWQQLSFSPLTICDVGHNIAGLIEVVSQIKQLNCNCVHWVFGTVNDKDISEILQILPKEFEYYFTKANIPRALDEEELFGLAKEFHLKGQSFKTVKEALTSAQKNAKTTDLIFIGGSTFIVAEALEFFA